MLLAFLYGVPVQIIGRNRMKRAKNSLTTYKLRQPGELAGYAAAGTLAPPIQSDTPTAVKLLKRWAEALGGVEKITRIKNLYLRSVIKSGGLEGTSEHWQTVEGLHKQSIELGGVFSQLSVFNGHEGWVRDQNAKVRELAGTELAEEVSAAYLGSFSHLIGGRMAGAAEYLGEDKDKRFYILKLQPQGGLAITCYLDKTTYLPAREEQTGDGQTSTMTFADWREVEGVKFAFQQRYSTADPTDTVLQSVQLVSLNTPLDESAFQQPQESKRDFTFASGDSAQGIPFELINNIIFVEAGVNHSKPLKFILDTGASFSVLSEESARALGLQSKGSFTVSAGGGSTGMALVKGVTFNLPGVALQNQSVAVLPLKSLEQYIGSSIDGVLGYDFISRFVMEIRYAEKRINLSDPHTYIAKDSAKSIPITLEDNTPHFHARVTQADGTVFEGQFGMDTGASAAVGLFTPFVEAHHLLAANPKTIEVFNVGAAGKSRQRLGRLQKLQFGEFEILNPIARFYLTTKGALAGSDVAGLIGDEVFRRFDLTIDYEHKRLLLEPNANFADADEYNMSGLILVAFGLDHKNFKVEELLADSPAIAAGIQRGDILEAIDGKPAEGYTLSQLDQMFKQPEHTYQLSVRRGKKVLQTGITTKRLL
jgi:hypothetical protein